MIKNISKKLQKGQPTIGTWLQIPSPDVAEILGRAGYDWVAVDLEHGCFGRQSLPDIFRALELGGTVPLARVARCHPNDIKQALDSGAQGLILPMIETAPQLEKGIASAHYPPHGGRGVGYSRANLFGQNFDNYVSTTGSQVFIVAQIEHIRAVDNLDDILSTDRLDAIMIGPYDLSGSMGITGDFSNPEFKEVMATVLAKARQHNIPSGVHIVQPDEELLTRKIREGYQFIAYGTDAVFLYNGAKCPRMHKTTD